MSTPAPTPALTPDQIRAQIERTRAELAETVDALAAKADVKAQARDKVEDVKAQAKDKAGDLVGTVKEKAADLVETVKDRASGLKDSASGVRDKAVGLKDEAVDAVAHGGHAGRGDRAASAGPASADDETVVLTETGAHAGTDALSGAGVTPGTVAPSRHRAPDDTSGGPVAQARDKATAAAGSVASAASGAAADVREKAADVREKAADVRAEVAGATGADSTGASEPHQFVIAPLNRSNAPAAVAAVLAVLAVLVIVRKRRAAGA